MKPSHTIKRRAKLLVTILGKQPDEFGLLPDEDGYVTVKQLMRVLSQEEGWAQIGWPQIKEVIYASRTPVIELQDNRIRAVDRSNLPVPQATDNCPKRLYYPVRRRAYPGILANGIRAAHADRRILMAAEKAMADRLGRRIDASPVILTVDTVRARSHGALTWRYGRGLYLLDRLPNDCFSGPLLPRPKAAPPEGNAALPRQPKAPGSYVVELGAIPLPDQRRKAPRRGPKNEWKRERKRRNRSTR